MLKIDCEGMTSMSRKRFTDEQITEFLRQAKDGVPNKKLCEKYGFSVSTLRRWKELHDNVVRNQLEKMESTAAIVYLGIIIASLLLTIFSHKAAGMLFTLLMPGHCIYYVVRYRKVSGKFISSDNVFLSRSGRGANNVFYRLSWVFVFIILSSIVYAILT